ncbi:hypothetical protein BX666DRAFT_1868315 [Dichotomocladium elegans]|nr:hypothetical protein BX666DRAFT_1868315 [Dichotomocladium elegans]
MQPFIFCFLVIISLASAMAASGKRYQGVASVMQNHRPLSGNQFSKRHGRGTWYDGKDLTNAACYGRLGLPRWDASTQSMIGAMAMNDFEECYKCVRITNNKKPDLSITVMIVDKCAAFNTTFFCLPGKAIDLTPHAFKLLEPAGNLAVGVLDISWEPCDCNEVDNHPQVP